MFDVQLPYPQLLLDFKSLWTCNGFVGGFLKFQGVLGVEEVIDSRVWPYP